MGYGGPRFAFFTLNDFNNHTATIHKEDEARVRDILRREAAMEVDPQQRDQWLRTTYYPATEHCVNSTPYYANATAGNAATSAYAAQSTADLIAAGATDTLGLAARSSAIAKKNGMATSTAAKATTKGGAVADASMSQRHLRSTRQQSEMVRLSQPRPQVEPGYGSLMYGRCMQQRTRVVEFPEGRGGQRYCPGVDRDRRVPAPPANLHDTSAAPWVGSYSTQRHRRGRGSVVGSDEAGTVMSKVDAPQRTAVQEAARRAAVEAIAQSHMPCVEDGEEGSYNHVGSRSNGYGEAMDGAYTSQADRYYTEGTPTTDAMHRNTFDVEDDDVPSVFSHASSTGPIVAVGVQHMGMVSTKPQTQLHLSRYGGSMTAPRTTQRHVVRDEELTLPQLTARVIQSQRA